MNLINLKESLYKSYSKDLCYPKVTNNWSSENKTYGMCAITSLIVHDYFGGNIGKIYVDDISHYFNVIDNEIIDLTKEQFNKDLDYSNYEVISKDILINNENTNNRYILLKRKVIEALLNNVDYDVSKCFKCNNLVEHFPNNKTVHLGENLDILLIGEAPANNGWRKSHMLWKDINGKILPSGNVLQKLFDIIGEDIFRTSFIESIKCYPLDRKNIKACANNCKSIMLEQISIIKPKIIITLGDAATRNLLDFEYKNFKEVVGNTYNINNSILIPIYHPSPVSPNSYKSNIPIFEKLKKIKEI